MSELPDFAALANTDAAVEASRIEAGEPWCVCVIAGLQYYRYARHDELLGRVMPQPGDRLNLVRAPENPHDKNAVEVWWRNQHMLGHLPWFVAIRVAPLIDAGQPLRGYVYHPGNGQAWSLRAFLVGAPVTHFHECYSEET